MNIKHWQGYGIVTATKIKDANCDLHIKVKGNHEWGLVRNDEYDIFRWLVSKFDRGGLFNSDRDISRMEIVSDMEDGIEVAHYLIWKDTGRYWSRWIAQYD